MKYTTEELRIRLPCRTSGIFRRSGVARRSLGTPISDVFAVTTSGRYRDVRMAVVRKLFGHVDIWDELDDDDRDRIGEVALSPDTLA